MCGNLAKLLLPCWLVRHREDETVLLPLHLKHQLTKRRVNRLLLLAGRSTFDFYNDHAMVFVFGHDVSATKRWVRPDRNTEGYQCSFRYVRAGRLVGGVLTTVCAFHCVDIYPNSPTFARRETVRHKPTLNFELVHGVGVR
jgi:hypothetical protein